MGLLNYFLVRIVSSMPDKICMILSTSAMRGLPFFFKCRKGDFNLFAENNEVLILNVTK